MKHRLKIAKVSSIFDSTQNTQKLDLIDTPGLASADPWRVKRGTLWDFSPFLLQNIKKWHFDAIQKFQKVS